MCKFRHFHSESYNSKGFEIKKKSICSIFRRSPEKYFIGLRRNTHELRQRRNSAPVIRLFDILQISILTTTNFCISYPRTYTAFQLSGTQAANITSVSTVRCLGFQTPNLEGLSCIRRTQFSPNQHGNAILTFSEIFRSMSSSCCYPKSTQRTSTEIRPTLGLKHPNTFYKVCETPPRLDYKHTYSLYSMILVNENITNQTHLRQLKITLLIYLAKACEICCAKICSWRIESNHPLLKFVIRNSRIPCLSCPKPRA